MGLFDFGLVSAPVCTSLVIWLALFNTLELLFLMPGRTRLQLIFVVVKVFGVGPYWMSKAPCSSFILLMLKKEKALLRNVMVGGVWNGFLLGRVRH